jgi:uncharacterized membrane protein YeaQ/YmgE (transglycosylase-associated protein family)
MESAGLGWVASIIIGGIAGWIAEKLTGSNMGLIVNIVLGMIGAALAAWLFNLAGITLAAGWLGYLIAGIVGASLLIVATRLIAPDRWRA